jgi:hypothetical protein
MVDPNGGIDRVKRASAAAWAALRFGLAAAQPSESPGAFSLYQSLEPLPDQTGLLLQPLKAWAFATSSSSSASVVRITQPLFFSATMAPIDADSNAAAVARRWAEAWHFGPKTALRQRYATFATARASAFVATAFRRSAAGSRRAEFKTNVVSDAT